MGKLAGESFASKEDSLDRRAASNRGGTKGAMGCREGKTGKESCVEIGKDVSMFCGCGTCATTWVWAG